MDNYQRELRRDAARSFFESLDKLQDNLQLGDRQQAKSQEQSGMGSQSKPQRGRPARFTFADLEQAAADIEEFFQERNRLPTEPKD
ncbi:hypothetical protein [Kamptonema formosum]|uniref:hypothetical protein n=1 Tax=Kamptonema formosum TaxID=331992 RepID=UPI0003485D00|nr:hypothetical protein [Oscillatoria sp. PCC 10802]